MPPWPRLAAVLPPPLRGPRRGHAGRVPRPPGQRQFVCCAVSPQVSSNTVLSVNFGVPVHRVPVRPVGCLSTNKGVSENRGGSYCPSATTHNHIETISTEQLFICRGHWDSLHAQSLLPSSIWDATRLQSLCRGRPAPDSPAASSASPDLRSPAPPASSSPGPGPSPPEAPAAPAAMSELRRRTGCMGGARSVGQWGQQASPSASVILLIHQILQDLPDPSVEIFNRICMFLVGVPPPPQ